MTLTKICKNPFKDPKGPIKSSHTYLVCLIPAVLISDAQFGVVIKECFTAGGLSPRQHSVIKRRQPPPVLVVWRCSQRQQDLENDTAENINLRCRPFSSTDSHINNNENRIIIINNRAMKVEGTIRSGAAEVVQLLFSGVKLYTF